MRMAKLIVLFWLAILGVALLCYAQAEAEPILYHWVTQNEVILWQSSADDQPVKAMFNPQTKEWRVAPSEAATHWRPILEKFVRLCYPKMATQTLLEDRMWSFALTKLRNEYDNVIWAEQRRPFVEIYLIQKGEGEVEMTFIHELNGQVNKETIKFTQQSGGKWVKKGDINLETLLGLTITSKGLHEVLDIPSEEQLPTGSRWLDVWDRWVRNFLTNKPVRPTMYQDMNGQLKWLWRERLNSVDELRTAFRTLPPAPDDIEEPDIVSEVSGGQNPSSPSGFPWLFTLSIIVNLILAAIIWFLFRFRTGLPMPRPSLPRVVATPWRNIATFWGRASQGQAAFSFVVTIETLHKRAKDRYLEKFKGDLSLRPMVLTSLDWARDVYLDLAASDQSQQEMDTYKKNIVVEFLQHDLEVETESTQQVKGWIKLGQMVENAVSKINKQEIPEGALSLVESSVKGWKKNDLRNYTNQLFSLKIEDDSLPSKLEGLLEIWPNVLAAFAICLNKVMEERNSLETSLKDQGEKHAKAINDKECDLKKRWEIDKGKLDNINQELEEKYKQASSNLKSAESENQKLQSQVAKLLHQSAELKSAREVERSNYKEFDKKIGDILEVQQLSRDLRQWLQGYFYDANDKGEIRPVALLASLINYSLCQMCFSIIEEQPALRKVMASNIFRLTQQFDQRFNKVSDFKATLDYLGRLAPQVENVLASLEKTDRGGYTIDNQLFLGFLNRLKTDTGKDLSPFFIDMDKENKKLTFVNAS